MVAFIEAQTSSKSLVRRNSRSASQPRSLRTPYPRFSDARVGSRFYDNKGVGRWTTMDPLGITGGLNQYVFCSDNPVNFRDPFGLLSDSEKKDIIHAIAYTQDMIAQLNEQQNYEAAVNALKEKYPGSGEVVAETELERNGESTIKWFTVPTNKYLRRAYLRHECTHRQQWRKLWEANKEKPYETLRILWAGSRTDYEIEAWTVQLKFLEQVLNDAKKQ